MSSQWITLGIAHNTTGDTNANQRPLQGPRTFSGYLSLPPTGSGPGLVLLQEIWGVNDHIQAVADQYAQAGFVVLAPDVFWRQAERPNLAYDEAGQQQAFKLYKTLNIEQASIDTTHAIEVLRQRPEVTGKVGIMGFCLGGLLSYRATAATSVAATVCYYGGGIAQHLNLAPQIKNPVMFHHGGQDDHIPSDDVNAIKNAFSHHPQTIFHDYPSGNHGFNCWGRPAMYHRPSAVQAQGHTLTFLATHLCE